MPRSNEIFSAMFFTRVIAPFILWSSILASTAGCSTWAAERINWQVLTETGQGIPEVEIAENTILGSREELIFDNKNSKQGKRVICVRSLDGGTKWERLATIVEDLNNDIDLGDGSMIRQNGMIYYIYRYNKFAGKYADQPYYSIRIKQSSDAGKSWSDHSIVEEIRPPKGRKSGLWTPRLLVTSSGIMQAYYDDGDLPERIKGGTNQGQWGVMKSWNKSNNTWENMVITSRPPVALKGPLNIVADGARTPLEISPGHIWSPVESVILDDKPGSRSLVLRYTESLDYGKSWSWQHGSWPILYELPPKVGNEYYDWSWPLAVQLRNGNLVVVFRSNEKSSVPTKGTAHQTDKYPFFLLSSNKGRSWTKEAIPVSIPIIDHGLVAMSDGSVIVGLRNKLHPSLYTVLKGTVYTETGKTSTQEDIR
jgi:hypothetical protein